MSENKTRKPYNAKAYEKIFETVGGYYWDGVMPEKIKLDFLERMYQCKDPSITPKMATAMANTVLRLLYKEFDEALLRDIFTFQRIYAHNEVFIKFANRPDPSNHTGNKQ